MQNMCNVSRENIPENVSSTKKQREKIPHCGRLLNFLQNINSLKRKVHTATVVNVTPNTVWKEGGGRERESEEGIELRTRIDDEDVQ